MTDRIECALDVGIKNPAVFAVPIEATPTLFDGVVATTSWAEAIAVRLTFLLTVRL